MKKKKGQRDAVLNAVGPPAGKKKRAWGLTFVYFHACACLHELSSSSGRTGQHRRKNTQTISEAARITQASVAERRA